MAIRRWLHAAAAASIATGAARAQVLDLEGVQFPPPGQAETAFVTTAAGRGEHVAIENVVVKASGATSGLSIAMLPTQGPWPDLECVNGRGSLAGNVTTIGAVNAPLEVGQVGNSETELAAAGPWAVVVVNCGTSEGSYIAGGTVSVRGTRGFLPAHVEGTVIVQAGFGVAYTALALLWACFTFRRASASWSETPLAQQAVSALAVVCVATTLATIGATAAQQRMGSVLLDIGSIAQALRVAQVVFTFMGVAIGAACSGARGGVVEGRPSVVAVEVGLTIFSGSLALAFGVLGRRTAGIDLEDGWTSASFVAAAAVFVVCVTWVLRHMGRRMRELREAAAATGGEVAAGSLVRLRVTLGLFLFAAPAGAAATMQAITASTVSYHDVVLAEQAGSFAVLVALMAIWAREVAEDQSGKAGYAQQRVPCTGDVEDPIEAGQPAGAENRPCTGPCAETVGSPSKMTVE